MRIFWLVGICLGLAGCGGRSGAGVEARPQSIQLGVSPALTLPGSVVVSATTSSGLPVEWKSQTPSVCSVSASGTVTALATGNCQLLALQTGNTVYAPAVPRSFSLPISAAQSIAFGTLPSIDMYGSARVAVSASSGLPVSLASATPGVCTVTKEVVTAVSAGICTLTADQAGDGFYSAATFVSANFSVLAGTAFSAPSAPQEVAARLSNVNTFEVSFIPPGRTGGVPVTTYQVLSLPAGLSATGSASPITLACPAQGCRGYQFVVTAGNANGVGSASAAADVLTRYKIRTVFYEPDTQPNDTVFEGSFLLNSSTGSVTELAGALTESMLGPPMPTVRLSYQLSSVATNAGLRVSAFALQSTRVYAEGGFSAGSQGFYYGYYDQPKALNPAAGGVGNSFVTVFIDPDNPLRALSPAEINQLAYGDCAAGGMMGDVCMTGWSGRGTMGGYPVSQQVNLLK